MADSTVEGKTERLTKGFGYEDKSGKTGYGQITDEAVAALASRIGTERTHGLADWELHDGRFTAPFIRQIANSQGDYNPLYLDMDYARQSPYGSLVCPPWVLVSIEVTNAARDGMPGLHAWFRGSTLVWYRPILLDDWLKGTGILIDVRRMASRTTKEAVIQEYENIGTNQRGEVVGRMFTSWHRAERQTAKDVARSKELRGLAMYSPEDLKRIREDYKKEVRRGKEPRFWEDVEVGEALPHVVKGPTSQAQRVVGEGGSPVGFMGRGDPGDWSHTHANAFKLFERHPGLPFVNEWGIPEVPVVIHNSHERCQRYLGLPGAYDAGYQRVYWTVHMLTNWIGDHGFLHKLSTRFNAFNIMGDTTWCYGKVTDKRVEGDKHLVDLTIWNDNQLGVKVTEGTATVVLPSKTNPGARTWPLDTK